MNFLVSSRAQASIESAQAKEAAVILKALEKIKEADDQRSLGGSKNLRKLGRDPQSGEDYALWELRLNLYQRFLLRFIRDEANRETVLIVDYVDRRRE